MHSSHWIHFSICLQVNSKSRVAWTFEPRELSVYCVEFTLDERLVPVSDRRVQVIGRGSLPRSKDTVW